MREHPAGTVTFVFTDIEGSTALVQRLRERWPEIRSAHRKIVREAFEAHGGDEVDAQGDSFFYVFRRARDAALAASEAQRRLAAHAWPEDGVIRIRIGMHTGEPVISDEGYHGIGVHRAARIMAAGHGGQVLLSEAAAAVLRDEEVAGVAVRDLGTHRLKDLDRPEHVYQLVGEGLQASFPRIRTTGEERPYYRRPLVIGATAGVLAAAVAIPVFAFAGGSSQGSPLTAAADNSVAVVDETSHRLDAQTTEIYEPHAVAAGAGAIWVTSGGGSVAKIDPETHELKQTIDVGAGPEGLAVHGNDVWIANSLDNSLSRVSAETDHEVAAPVPVGNTPTGVAVGDGSVWVANAGDETVTEVDGRTGTVKRTIDVHAPVRGIAYGASSLWVTDPIGNEVIRVPVDDPSSSTSIDVGTGPTAVAYGAGAVWVANNISGTVSRIDPATNAMTSLIAIGAAPNGIAVGDDAVWVSSEVDGEIVRLDAKNGDVTSRTHLGGRPEGVVAADGSVWVSVQAAGAAHRGGTLRLLTPILDYIDPALAYYVGTWDIISVTNDGLVGFKRVGGVDGNTIVPDLATSVPRASDNGRSYAFQLRRGIRFSNGKEVTPEDVRATFERMYRAYGYQQPAKGEKPTRDASPGLGYYAAIVGASACVAHPGRCDLSHGIVVNDTDRTVTFHLEKPDSEFLYKLAIPFAAIVPKGTAVGGTHPVPGTGPYKVAEYTPYRYVRLSRNPYFHVWSGPAQPAGLPDTIELSTNLTRGKGEPMTTRRAFEATAAGRADVAEGGVPADLLPTARTEYPGQLHVTPAPQTNWLFLNTNKLPFSNIHARRAVAYALDRARMVTLQGGADVATATCQILPPGLSGYEPYCPFTAGPQTGRWTAPDLPRARAELARSRTRGARVRVISAADPSGDSGQNIELAATLRRLGYRVTLTQYRTDSAYFNEMFGNWKRVDAVVNGWVQDFPAPSNYFGGLTCPNSPYYCSPRYRRRFAAVAEAATARNSNEPWTAFDREVTDSAAVIPYDNLKSIDFVSKRVGNYQHHPEFDLLIDQLWVR